MNTDIRQVHFCWLKLVLSSSELKNTIASLWKLQIYKTIKIGTSLQLEIQY